ncbi:MAG: DNA repair exonuclease [Tissierellia bacterium]|nr:DNA repair exonuclease [Tissierellia bacterium]
MISFIHTGDLHLGLQFKSMRFDSNERRFELWHTFERIVHKAMEEKVDFLFIAGDLYEESYFTYKDIKRVKDILSKAEAVQILIAAGNHDTLNKNSLYYSVEWPDNVTIFGTEGIEKKEFPHKNTAVYGYSWPKGESDEDPFKCFEGIDKGKTNILLIHGDAITKDEKYLPLDGEYLQSLGFDYIALGHIHQPAIISENMVYCGSPEPLSFKESGDHGIIKGYIENKNTNIDFIPFSSRTFLEKTIELDGSLGYAQILDKMRSLGTKDELGRNFYKVTLRGLVSPEEKIIASDMEKELSNDFYYIEIIDETKVDYDLDVLERENRDNIIGFFIREMKKKDLEDQINRQALYLGLEALMKGRVGL